MSIQTESSADLADLRERAELAFADIPAGPAERRQALRALLDWCQQNPQDRPQLEHLVYTAQWSTLFDAFYRLLPFGTGGRRGPVGIGTNRFNPQTLSSSVQGHADYLKSLYEGRSVAVVVAYDVRQYNDLRGVYTGETNNPLQGLTSIDFARIAAEVYAANGIAVHMPVMQPEPVFLTTPELSFSIRKLNAQGGLYISASHNHPDDNGGKIFNARGGQEVPPSDHRMASFVAAVTDVHRLDLREARARGLIKDISPAVHRSYIDLNAALGFDRQKRGARVAFTPLHGTGMTSVYEALQQAGFDVHLVPDQTSLDGQFPTVPFRAPNPEVADSMSRACEYAECIEADIVMSCDPDADRIGMCARDAGGEYVFLNGNQLSILAVHYVLENLARREDAPARPLIISTEVTTSMLRTISEFFGARIIDSLLVGFKYHGAVLSDLEDYGRHGGFEASVSDFAVATEESHGLLMSPQVRDKDAAGAAIILAELAASLKDRGQTVPEYLRGIYRRHGYYANYNSSLVMTGAVGTANIRAIQTSLRDDPPKSIDGLAVCEKFDHWDEHGRFGSFQGDTDRAARDLLVYHLEDGSRCLIRPSGTEPKNKSYIEVRCAPATPAEDDASFDARVAATDAKAQALAESLSKTMLERIGISLPEYALRLSNLLSLDARLDFANRFLPELWDKADGYHRSSPETASTNLMAWADDRLANYGKDPRALVAPGIKAYLRSLTDADDNAPSEAVRRLVVQSFY